MVPDQGRARKHHEDVASAWHQEGLKTGDPESVLVAIIAQLAELGKLCTRIQQLAAAAGDQTAIDLSCALETARGSLHTVVRTRIDELRADRAVAADSLEPGGAL